jgi:16S rRNA processing protein RimM
MLSGRMNSSAEGRIEIGRISGASGIRGEVKLFHYSGECERLVGVEEFYFSESEGGVYRVENLRMQGRTPIVKLAGVDGRTAAEALIGFKVFVEISALNPLEDGRYYVVDLIGASVEDESGKVFGRVSRIEDNPAHDLLHVTRDEGDFLLPFIDIFVLDVDPIAKRIIIRPPEGLAK